MKLKQYIILFLSLAAFATSAYAGADNAKLLSSEDDNSPEAQKYAKLVDIYTEALEKDDVPLHVKCLNDIIKYCHESNQPKREADAISTRVVYFYNRSLDDSLAKYAPQDLKVLEQYKNWKRYYELWTYLANSYLYSSIHQFSGNCRDDEGRCGAPRQWCRTERRPDDALRQSEGKFTKLIN